MPKSAHKFDDFTDSLRRMLGESEIDQVIEELLDLLEPLENEHLKTVIMTKSVWVNMRQQESRGMMDFGDLKKHRQHACKCLLDALEALEKEAAVVEHFNRRYQNHLQTTAGRHHVYAVVQSLDPRVQPPFFEITKSAIVGRSDACDIYINEIRISRQHAKFTIEHGKVFIEDLGSVNKTFLNEREVTAPAHIAEGDNTLYLYDVELRVKII